MAGSQVWNTVGQEAKGWGNLLMSLSQRKREEKRIADQDSYRMNQDALQASNSAAAAQKEQERYDYQKLMGQATDLRAKQIHEQNQKDWEAKNLDKVMMEGAVGQIPVQYPEGITYEGANQLFQEQGVIDNPEAQKILAGLRKDDQFDANAALRLLIANQNNATRKEVKTIPTPEKKTTVTTSGKNANPEDVLKGLQQRKKELDAQLKPYGDVNAYIKQNPQSAANLKTLESALKHVENQITNIYGKIGAKAGSEADGDPNVQEALDLQAELDKLKTTK